MLLCTIYWTVREFPTQLFKFWYKSPDPWQSLISRNLAHTLTNLPRAEKEPKSLFAPENRFNFYCIVFCLYFVCSVVFAISVDWSTYIYMILVSHKNRTQHVHITSITNFSVLQLNSPFLRSSKHFTNFAIFAFRSKNWTTE